MSDAVSVLRDAWMEAAGAPYADDEYCEAVAAKFERVIDRVKAEALLTDEAVERAARTITPELYYHYDEWGDANEEDRARALKMARTALTAALDA